MPLFAALVGDAHAQTAADSAWLARLEARAAALRTEASFATGGDPGPHDTIRVRSLLILTDSADHGRLRDALDVFGNDLDRVFGATLPGVLDSAQIVVSFSPPRSGWVPPLADDAQFIRVLGRTTRPHFVRELSQAVHALLLSRGGPDFRSWDAEVRLFEDPGPLFTAAYVELLTSAFPSARECLAGDVAACARALRLAEGSVTAGPEDLASLRAFIEDRLRHRATDPRLAPAYARCTTQEDAAACLEFLDLAGLEEPGLSTRARGTLLRFTRTRGDAAYARFFADTAAAVPDRLEAAAGMPLDSLLAAWRATVLEHRPEPMAIPAATQWMTAAWVLVLLGLATRSTRWR